MYIFGSLILRTSKTTFQSKSVTFFASTGGWDPGDSITTRRVSESAQERRQDRKQGSHLCAGQESAGSWRQWRWDSRTELRRGPHPRVKVIQYAKVTKGKVTRTGTGRSGGGQHRTDLSLQGEVAEFWGSVTKFNALAAQECCKIHEWRCNSKGPWCFPETSVSISRFSSGKLAAFSPFTTQRCFLFFIGQWRLATANSRKPLLHANQSVLCAQVIWIERLWCQKSYHFSTCRMFFKQWRLVCLPSLVKVASTIWDFLHFAFICMCIEICTCFRKDQLVALWRICFHTCAHSKLKSSQKMQLLCSRFCQNKSLFKFLKFYFVSPFSICTDK